MGLDMYLFAGRYEGKYINGENYGKVGFYPDELKELQEEVDNRSTASRQILYKVGYWRKANAIHEWFINHCAEGVDDCRQVYVSREDLTKLLGVCKSVLKDHSKASELLPTCDGFFFGTTDYDDWYYHDLEYTKNLISKLLKLGDNYDFYYEASW